MGNIVIALLSGQPQALSRSLKDVIDGKLCDYIVGGNKAVSGKAETEKEGLEIHGLGEFCRK